jgi:hypothetical protein
MASLRRYAIANYEEKRCLTKLIFKNNLASLFITLIGLDSGFFLLTIKPEMEVSRWLFNYLPYEVIHDLGIVCDGFDGLIGVYRCIHHVENQLHEKSNRSFTGEGLFSTLSKR